MTNTEHTARPVRAKRDKGFTLVELLIVIVILGILATITVFAVRGITSDAQDTACDADKRTIETALEAFFAGTGDYPEDVEELVTPVVAEDGSSRTYLVTNPGTWEISEGAAPALVGVGKCGPGEEEEG